MVENWKKPIRNAAQEAMESRARTLPYSLREEGADAIGMPCGGDVTVFIEPYMTRPVLLIVGGELIGRPLSEMARIAGYDVKVMDVQPERGDHAVLAPEENTPYTYVVPITEGQDQRPSRRGLPMVLTISDEEFMRMKGVVLDKDHDEALELIKTFIKRLEQQSRQGLRPHLEGG